MPIKVKIVQLGKGVLHCEVEDGTPVEASLVKLGITGGGMDLHVNGRPTEHGQMLHDGDLVTIIPRIKGGLLVPAIGVVIQKYGRYCRRKIAACGT